MLSTGLELVTLFLSCVCKLMCDIDTGNFWRTIERHKVNALFTAPTALRAIKRLDAEGMLYNKYVYMLSSISICIVYVIKYVGVRAAYYTLYMRITMLLY